MHYLKYLKYALFFMFLCCPISAAQSNVSADIPAIEELRASLSEMTPAYSIPERPLLYESDGVPVSIRLLGFDIKNAKKRISSTPISYMESSKLKFTLYWLPEGPIPEGLTLRMKLTGSGPSIQNEYPVIVQSRQIGVVSKQEIQFSHPNKRYSGDGTLTFSTFTANEDKNSDSLLYSIPVDVETKVYRSRLASERLREVYGEAGQRLNTLFRLGRAAAVTLKIPGGSKKVYTGIGLVSATKYDSKPFRGEKVCAIEVVADGNSQTYYMEHGISTAKADHDYYPPNTLGTNKIEIFASTNSNRKNVLKKDFDVHDYAGRISFEKPVSSGEIKIKYLKNKGVIDVYEVVLLKSQ